jgi:hypothetical protein
MRNDVPLMLSRRNKKGWFFSVLKNHPVNSALPGAKRNIPYAELGIRAIFMCRSATKYMPALAIRLLKPSVKVSVEPSVRGYAPRGFE